MLGLGVGLAERGQRRVEGPALGLNQFGTRSVCRSRRIQTMLSAMQKPSRGVPFGYMKNQRRRFEGSSQCELSRTVRMCGMPIKVSHPKSAGANRNLLPRPLRRLMEKRIYRVSASCEPAIALGPSVAGWLAPRSHLRDFALSGPRRFATARYCGSRSEAA